MGTLYAKDSSTLALALNALRLVARAGATWNVRSATTLGLVAGLVAGHYFEVLEGWRDCRALVTFGTPHRGSVNAIDTLANGFKKLFLDLTETMRSFKSVYQLLPIYEAVKVDDTYHRAAELEDLPGAPVLIVR